MTENRHYFVQFFTEVEHVFSLKLVASYHVIILLWPRNLIKSTASNTAELLTDAHLLVSNSHQEQFHSVSANMQCSCPVQNLTQ